MADDLDSVAGGATEPDWIELRKVGAEVARLTGSGARQLSRSDFDRILASARNAANGSNEFIEFVLNHEPA